jgi:hypothetical protein
MRWILDNQGIPQYALSKRSGLSAPAIFQNLNKSERQVTQPPLRSTVAALGKAVGADVRFDSKKHQVALVQKYDLPTT